MEKKMEEQKKQKSQLLFLERKKRDPENDKEVFSSVKRFYKTKKQVKRQDHKNLCKDK